MNVTTPVNRFFEIRSTTPSTAAIARELVNVLAAKIGIGAIPVDEDSRKAVAARSGALWRDLGWRFRLEVGDSIGHELRDALTGTFGAEAVDSLNDGIFMFLAFAAVGDRVGMRLVLPHVKAQVPFEPAHGF